MTRSETLSHWRDQVNHHLPTLSATEAEALALWSIGMVLAESAALGEVTLRVHTWLEETKTKFSSFRQRLRNFYLPAERKPGLKRADWNPDEVFPDLITWVLSLLRSSRLVLALDATTVRDRVTILCASLLIDGCAIPIAWRCIRGNEKDSWNRHWLQLLWLISRAIPQEYEVIVLTDRGLWSPKLFRAIEHHGWHPLMRVNWDTGTDEARFLPEKQKRWRKMRSLAPRQGAEVQIPGKAFASHKIPCTLIIHWGESAKEPWYLLTDSKMLPSLTGSLYAARMWIEHQFKTIKSDGWHVEKSRMDEPDRIARMWLGYTVAMLWSMATGSQPIAGLDPPKQAQKDGEPEPASPSEQDSPAKASQPAGPAMSECLEECARRVAHTFSWFRRGITILADRIATAAELQCPKFYYPNQCQKWAHTGNIHL